MAVAPDLETTVPPQGQASPGEIGSGLRDCEGLRLLIVGGGMAGYGLCDRLVNCEAHRSYKVTIFGDEPTPAYDRVNLSKLFSGRTADELELAPREWYDEHGITLKTGCRITEIDRESKEIVDQNGARYPYNRLVLATGSRPKVPPIPGAELPGVFVYRTLDDLESIRRFVTDGKAKVGAVIGGGLLGLEAAKVLQDLGLQTTVIEMAPGLMPRQLDSDAAGLLKQRVEELGVAVHLVRRTESITPRDDDRLRMHFANAEPLDVDVLIIAAGVTPNDSLARESGLSIGPHGGIAIDSRLRTSDPNVFAIGECASFKDHVFGLVAPCFRMADVLANRLAGQTDEFRGADESAELKLLGVNVAALGLAIGESPGGIKITQRSDTGYRKLILDRGRIVGAACVGDWDELPQIRQAVMKQTQLWPWQRRRFVRTGSPWLPGGAIPVADWPAESVICSCLAVTKQSITRWVDEGIRDANKISELSGASTACGSCRSLVCELAGAEREPAKAVPGAKTMLIASLVSLVLVPLMIALPPLPYADSVQSAWRQIDLLWRSDFARQVTGFSVLALILIGLVFSLRKRIPWFRWGSYGFWRSAHGVLGAAVLIAVAVHTGLRLGENLNFVLSSVFIATAGLGSVAGILSGLEGKAEGARAIFIRRWRPRLTLLHLWLFWPLPLLIGVHVLSFYWFDG